MYIPTHFTLQEVLPVNYYAKQFPVYGIRLWLIFDDRILETADILRDMYGPMIINTMHDKDLSTKYGAHQWRGYRDHTSPYVYGRNPTTYGNISQHRFGRALDLVPVEKSVDKIRRDIVSGLFKYITRVEMDVSWLHIDTANHLGTLKQF